MLNLVPTTTLSTRPAFPRRFVRIAVCLTLSTVFISKSSSQESVADGDAAEGIAFFESKIRPLLEDHCLECHSSDTEPSGGLLLDSRDLLVRGGDSGTAVDLGAPAKSLVLKAVNYGDPDLQMPPDGKLPAQSIADLRQWIEMGVPDPRRTDAPVQKQTGLPVERAKEHWAYRPRRKQFEFNSIDAFVNASLDEKGLSKFPKAESIDLLRRLTFDLTGLPPTRQQIAKFQSGATDVSYAAMVDSLLTSPTYGEAFARRWLDIVRYAESITLRGFVLPNAWRYRNYVIDAYNHDLPFDQFVQEQIAGDLLAEHYDESDSRQLQRKRHALIATSFWAMGNTNLEQQDKTQLEMDYIDEQLEVMGRTFLGQTIGCARCHDHKFDPIPTRDYYALAGILRSTVAFKHDNVSKWLDEPLPLSPPEQEQFEQLEQSRQQLKTEIAVIKKATPSSALPKKVPIRDIAGTVVDDSQAKLVGTWTPSEYVARMVGTGYLFHDLESTQRKTATFEAEDLQPGEYEVRLAYSAGSNRATKVRVDVFSADGEETVIVNQRKTPPIEGLWISLGKFRFETDGQAFVMLFSDGANGHVIADAVQFLPVANDSAPAVAVTGPSDDPGKSKKRLAKLEKDLRSVESELSKRPAYLGIKQSDEPSNCAIHVRGNVHNLTDIVERGVLTAIGESPVIPADSPGRVELSQWMISADNPLTPRVYANRIWCWLMGRGLVATVNNFGTTGQQPTHPKLLDWLAKELVDSGWSTKHLVSLIVHSDAYKRQLGSGNAEHLATDPDNAFYWRGHARRLSVEELRDAMLSASGELQSPPAGSTILPGTNADYNYKHAGNLRAIYQPVFRNSLPELFDAFDFADPSASVGQRPRSTVASQALVLSNHPWVIARASATAAELREQTAGGDEANDTHALVRAVYLQLLSRTPNEAELQVAVDYLGSGSLDKRLANFVHALFASLDFRYLR